MGSWAILLGNVVSLEEDLVGKEEEASVRIMVSTSKGIREAIDFKAISSLKGNSFQGYQHFQQRKQQSQILAPTLVLRLEGQMHALYELLSDMDPRHATLVHQFSRHHLSGECMLLFRGITELVVQ